MYIYVYMYIYIYVSICCILEFCCRCRLDDIFTRVCAVDVNRLVLMFAVSNRVLLQIVGLFCRIESLL